MERLSLEGVARPRHPQRHYSIGRSADSVPILIALNARAVLVSPEGERTVAVEDLYRNDGIACLTKRPEQLLTEIRLGKPGGWRVSYKKLRRGAFRFPVLSVGAAVRREGISWRKRV